MEWLEIKWRKVEEKINRRGGTWNGMEWRETKRCAVEHWEMKRSGVVRNAEERREGRENGMEWRQGNEMERTG